MQEILNQQFIQNENIKNQETAKIGEIENLIMNTPKEKASLISERISISFIISLFNSLSEEKLRTFSRIVAPSLNISKLEFYKTYRRQIDDNNERMKISMRTVFLNEFLKYTNNISSPEITEFFDSLKKQKALL